MTMLNISLKYVSLFTLIIVKSFCQVDNIQETQVQFKSDTVIMSGKLFVPDINGYLPAITILQGGSSNAEAHRATSEYYAAKFAKNGFVVLIYDKRGTGDSGGEVSKSNFDDYINDAINAVKFLKNQDYINLNQIGIFGPSQGGRIAALSAARSSDIAFIATLATPLVSIAELCLHSSMDFISRMGVTDSVKTMVEPLWKKHYSLIENNDSLGLKALDKKIEKFYSFVDTLFLPLKSEAISHLNDFMLGDFQPMYNSMSRDYISEIANVNIPWISIYAEHDAAVPVNQSIRIMKEQMDKSGNRNYEIQIIPKVNHAFSNIDTGEYFPVEDIAIEWILNNLL